MLILGLVSTRRRHDHGHNSYERSKAKKEIVPHHYYTLLFVRGADHPDLNIITIEIVLFSIYLYSQAHSEYGVYAGGNLEEHP